LTSKGWGRSELAADLYDELLFHGATFADLEKAGGPTVVVGATDLSTGSRLVFAPQNFDVMCAELSDFRLARAAAASSAVPVVLSAVTIDNYGGSCDYTTPGWLQPFLEARKPPRPAGRVMRRLRELRTIDENVKDRYMHLVDGGLADNLGLRGVLNVVETFEALQMTGQPTPLDHTRRLIVFVVNSVSTPKFDWNEREDPPRDFNALAKIAGVPIDRYANESVELLKDIGARWAMLRELRVGRAPNVEIYPIEVSFQAIEDEGERQRLNQIPTSLHLPVEAIDALRAAAASIVLGSPELHEALGDEWTNR
jgi:NTE family protein